MCDNYTIINLEMHESTNIKWSRQHINVFLGYVKYQEEIYFLGCSYCHNPQLGQEDNLFYNTLSIDRFMEGFFRGWDLSTNETQFFRLMRMGILDGREGYDMPMTALTRAMRHTAAVSARLFVMFEHERQQVRCLGMSD